LRLIWAGGRCGRFASRVARNAACHWRCFDGLLFPLLALAGADRRVLVVGSFRELLYTHMKSTRSAWTARSVHRVQGWQASFTTTAPRSSSSCTLLTARISVPPHHPAAVWRAVSPAAAGQFQRRPLPPPAPPRESNAAGPARESSQLCHKVWALRADGPWPVVIFCFTRFVVAAYVVGGSSAEPELRPAAHILVWKARARPSRHGDLIAYDHEGKKPTSGRVVGADDAARHGQSQRSVQ